MSVQRALMLTDPLPGGIDPKDGHTVHPVGYLGGQLMGEREKRYVPVVVRFDCEGKTRPLVIEFDQGQRYPVDKITDVRRAACQSVGGIGGRYTCRIKGQESYLWFEKGRWFAAAKSCKDAGSSLQTTAGPGRPQTPRPCSLHFSKWRHRRRIPCRFERGRSFADAFDRGSPGLDIQKPGASGSKTNTE